MVFVFGIVWYLLIDSTNWAVLPVVVEGANFCHIVLTYGSRDDSFIYDFDVVVYDGKSYVYILNIEIRLNNRIETFIERVRYKLILVFAKYH